MYSIRELRDRANITQFELAVALGVSVSAVYKWERGINEPKASTLREMSRLFGVTMDEILLEAKPVDRSPDTPSARASTALVDG